MLVLLRCGLDMSERNNTIRIPDNPEEPSKEIEVNLADYSAGKLIHLRPGDLEYIRKIFNNEKSPLESVNDPEEPYTRP